MNNCDVRRKMKIRLSIIYIYVAAVKETVRVILNDPVCKGDNARFTTVPLKLCLSKYE